MKITREWLDVNSPCADGGAWGIDFVGAEGRELEECIPAMYRADWLIWLVAKASGLDRFKVAHVVYALLMDYEKSDELDAIMRMMGFRADFGSIYKARKSACDAALQARTQYNRLMAHALAFHASILLASCYDDAMKKAQSCLNMLAAADAETADLRHPENIRAHRDLCDRIREKVWTPAAGKTT